MEENHLSACPSIDTGNNEDCSCPTEENRYLTLAKWSLYLFVFELTGGYFSGSLALMSDALHVLVDGTENFVSAIVSRFARQGNEERVRMIGGMTSALLLLLAATWIIREGWERMMNPQKVEGYMVIVATIGLLVNLLQWRIHHEAPGEHRNVTHLWQDRHLLSDISASIAVILGGTLMLLTDGWYWVDGVLSVGIGAWIVVFTVSRMLGFGLHDHDHSNCSEHEH